MQPLLLLGAAATLALPAVAQTSVTQLFLPFADQQPLDASLIAQNSDIATLAVQCAPGTSAEDCGLPLPITVTAGPSTFHFSGSGTYTILGEIDCKITGSTQAYCVATEGVYNTQSIATATEDAWISTPATATVTTSDTISGTDITFIPVTITAGLDQKSSAAMPTTSALGTGTKTSSGSASTSMTASSRTTAAATSNTSTTATSDAEKTSLRMSKFGVSIVLLALLVVA